MKLATMQFKNGKVSLIDPREGKAVETFDAKELERATDRLNEVNAEIIAANAPAPSAGRIEILSKDGKPVLGIPTTQATSAEVMKSKKGPITEADLADITGYVIVSRDRKGNVNTAFTNDEATDFGRCIPVTVQALETLRGWFVQQ